MGNSTTKFKNYILDENDEVASQVRKGNRWNLDKLNESIRITGDRQALELFELTPMQSRNEIIKATKKGLINWRDELQKSHPAAILVSNYHSYTDREI